MLISNWLARWQERCRSIRLRKIRAGKRLSPVAAECLEIRTLLSLGTLSVGAQVGALTYGTSGSATYQVTVNRGTESGAFNVDLSVITTLPSGVTELFTSPTLSFGAGDSSETTTLTLTTATKSPAAGSPHAFTVQGQVEGSPNDLSTGNGSLAIAQLVLTGTITASNKVYDGTTATTFITDPLTGVVSGDDVSLVALNNNATFDTKNVGTGKTVTASGLSLAGADAGNYALSNPTAATTANITARPLTGTITAGNKVYDGTAAAAITGRNLSGVITGDVVTYVGGTATFSDKNVGNGKTVTATGLSLSGADAGNYSVNTTATTAANITPLAITGSFTAANKIYDGTTAATINGTSLSGAISGDDVTYGGGTATFNNKNVGNGKTVTATGMGLTGADAANYTVNATATTTANITPLAITGSITVANKTYDGTTAATIAGRSLSGVLSGDAVTYVGGTATFSDKNVGNGITVNATGLSLSGADAGNYTVNSTATTTADITPATLTVTADDKQFIVGGSSLPPLTASFSGFVDDETLATSGVTGSPVLTTTATVSSPVGNYPITITQGTLAATNYTFTFVNGTLGIFNPTKVFVAVFGGQLNLLGDFNPHGVMIAVAGSNLELTGSEGTQFVFDGTTQSTLDIPLSQFMPLNGINITMPDGATITIDGTNMGTIAGDIVAFLGGGVNSFTLEHATVAADVNVWGANDGNTVLLSNDTIRDASIHTGFGSDSVKLSSVTFQSAPLFPSLSFLSGLTAGGNLAIDTGGGTDSVELDSVTGTKSLLGGWWIVSTGLVGNGTTTLNSVTTQGVALIGGVIGNQTITATGSTFGGPTVIGGQVGQNKINITGSTFDAPALVSTGIGNSPSISVEDSTFKSATAFVEVGSNPQLNLESSGTSGAGSTFQGPVLAAMIGPSATVNIGDPSGSDKITFNSFLVVVGGIPEATVNIDPDNTTLDNNKLVLILAKRQNV